MALLDLTPEEMIEVSGHWVTPENTLINGQPVPTNRPLILQYPLLAAMLPLLEEGHRSLLVPVKRVATAPPELKPIQERQALLDRRHDPLVRGLFGFFPALAELVMDEKLKKILLGLAAVIIPEGLSRTNLSYRRESGAAKRTEARLTNEHRGQLSQISIQVQGFAPIVLLNVVDELILVGKELGLLEDKKEALLSAQTAPSGPNEREAINLWINHTTTFLRLIEALKLPAEVEERLIGTLRELEQRAGERKKAPPTPPVSVETPEKADNGD